MNILLHFQEAKKSASIFVFVVVCASFSFAHSQVLPVAEGGTGASSFSSGSVLFMGTSTISQSSALYWDALRMRLGIGTTTPTQALELGVNKSIQLSTDKRTFDAVGLIRLQSLNDEAKAIIAYQDKAGKEVIWLQTHDYLKYPENQHKHFSIEASDSQGLKQTRLGVGYGADVVDVTVNQANLVINRNGGMFNGNIIMSGSGGGGTFKHLNSFSFYPNSNGNNTYALQLSLQSGNQLTLRALGSNQLTIDDSLKINGSLLLRAGGAASSSAPLKFVRGSLLSVPEDGSLEYDGGHLFFTIGSERLQLDRQGAATNSPSMPAILQRTAVSDVDYQALPTDQLIAYTALTTSRTVTLPAPATMPNKVLVIKDESGMASSSRIAINGSIEGESNRAITTNYGSIEIYSNGTGWFVK